MAVGARYYPDALTKNGSVVIYRLEYNEFTGDTWVQMGQILTGRNNADEFGYSVSLSDDGTTLVAGEPPYNGPIGMRSGCARAFRFNGTGWEQIGSDIQGSSANEYFGAAVSISGNGMKVAVGAPLYGATTNGRVRVFTYSPTNLQWIQIGFSLDGGVFDNFGWDVSLSQDGTTLAIGAPKNVNGGYTRMYKWDSINIRWTVLGGDLFCPLSTQYPQARFGWSVSLSSDGLQVGIGAPNAPSTSGLVNSGLASVYAYNSLTSTWMKMGDNIVGTPSNNQLTGWSVALSRDGARVAVGSPSNSVQFFLSGKVIVYEWTGSYWDSGQPEYGVNTMEDFGWAVDLANNGKVLAVGAPSTRNNVQSGMCFTYHVDKKG